MDITYPCEITHLQSGLTFQVNLTPAEVEHVNTDEDYANQISEKYYQLYLNGLVSATGNNTGEVTQIQESEEKEEEVSQVLSLRKKTLSIEDEETLIRLVSERPPLFNFKLPLRERNREKIKSLWEEVIAELNVDMTVETISKKWKNLRDSFIRARSNVKRKMASGSSAEEKLLAEKVRRNHRNYDLMLFLEDTFSDNKTVSNLKDVRTEEDVDLTRDQSITETPSTSRPQSRISTASSSAKAENSATDKCFLEAIQNLPKEKEVSATHSFCLRLADGLNKLPPRISNQLQVEFLSKLIEMENKYLYNE